MKIFELKPDGELPQSAIQELGRALTVKERIRNKSYGLGHLKLKDGSSLLKALYEKESNTIKTHFDWTTSGALIRMRTMQKIYAIGFPDDTIQNIRLTKVKDYIYAIPFSPFWTLLKLGIKPSVARWFAVRPEKFHCGPVFIEIMLLDNEKLAYEVPGDLWADCKSTFGINRIKDKTKIIDERLSHKY